MQLSSVSFRAPSVSTTVPSRALAAPAPTVPHNTFGAWSSGLYEEGDPVLMHLSKNPLKQLRIIMGKIPYRGSDRSLQFNTSKGPVNISYSAGYVSNHNTNKPIPQVKVWFNKKPSRIFYITQDGIVSRYMHGAEQKLTEIPKDQQAALLCSLDEASMHLVSKQLNNTLFGSILPQQSSFRNWLVKQYRGFLARN